MYSLCGHPRYFKFKQKYQQYGPVFPNYLSISYDYDKRHPTIKFTIEKQINHSIVFLDLFISGIDNQNLTHQTYHKLTYTGLLLNFKSFTSFSYKVSLIKCLIDRSLEICQNWYSFHNDIENIKSNLIKNAYPPFLIDKVVKKYLDYTFSSNQNQ